MLKRIFSGSLRRQLLTMATTVLLSCIILLSLIIVRVQQGQLNRLSENTFSAIKTSNRDTSSSLDKLFTKVETSLREMAGSVADGLAKETRKGIEKQKDFLSF